MNKTKSLRPVIGLLIGLACLSILLVLCSESKDSMPTGSDVAQETERFRQENQLFSIALNGTDQEFIDYLNGRVWQWERDSEGRSVLAYLYENASDSRISCLFALTDNDFPFGSFIDERDASALESIVTHGLEPDSAYLGALGVPLGSIAPYRDYALQWLVNGIERETADDGMLVALLRDGCSVSFRDEYGDTALDMACRAGLYSFASRLFRLEREEAKRLGVTLEPAYYTECGKSVVSAVSAMSGERLEVEIASLKPLLSDFSRRGMNLQTVLCACCDYGGSAEALTVLLELGADPDAPDENGSFPMFVATDAEKVRALINHGAKIDALNGDGISALTNACMHCNIDITIFLLSLGAKICDGDGDGAGRRSDVAEAFNAQCYGLCLALLDAGANPILAFSGQENPLTLMAYFPDSFSEDGTELARRLVAAGFRVDEPDTEGRTAICHILLAGDTVSPEAIEVFVDAAGPQTVAATQELIDSERNQSRQKELASRVQWTCVLGIIASLLIVFSILFQKSMFYVVSAFLGLVFAGILTGGFLGMILDSFDTSSHGWLKLPVWTILGIPAGCLLGFILFLIAPIRRIFYRYTTLYYIPLGLTVVLLGVMVRMVWS